MSGKAVSMPLALARPRLARLQSVLPVQGHIHPAQQGESWKQQDSSLSGSLWSGHDQEVHLPPSGFQDKRLASAQHTWAAPSRLKLAATRLTKASAACGRLLDHVGSPASWKGLDEAGTYLKTGRSR